MRLTQAQRGDVLERIDETGERVTVRIVTSVIGRENRTGREKDAY